MGAPTRAEVSHIPGGLGYLEPRWSTSVTGQSLSHEGREVHCWDFRMGLCPLGGETPTELGCLDPLKRGRDPGLFGLVR